MKITILIFVVAVFVIAAAVAYFALSNPGPVIKAAVENVGPRMTQTRVALAAAEMDILRGTGSLRGLEIGNPDGFETRTAVQLGSISFAVDSVRSNPILIREIIIDHPTVTYEHDFGGPSNIEVIRENIKAFTAAGGSAASRASGSTGSATASAMDDRDEGQGRKVIIEDLHILGANVSISAKGFRGKTVTQTLPEIHLTDIGKDRGGVTPAAAAQEIMAALTSQVTEFARSTDIPVLLGIKIETIGKNVGGAIEAIGKGLGGRSGAIDQDLERAVKQIESIGSNLKKIFD